MGDDAPTLVPGVPEPRQLAVYRMMALPPSSDGGVNETLSLVSPSPTVGAAIGTGAETKGVTRFERGDGGLVPNAFVAVTVHVYPAPLVNTVMRIGDTAPVLLPGTPVVEVQEAV